jgi:hypothetical protein
MDWQEAKDQTVALWEDLRARADMMDELELLTELNAAFPLCEAAEADLQASGGGLNHCRFCGFYQQFGGCRGISLRMSVRVVEHDRDGLRALIDEFLGQLRALAVPPPAAAAAAPAA